MIHQCLELIMYQRRLTFSKSRRLSVRRLSGINQSPHPLCFSSAYVWTGRVQRTSGIERLLLYYAPCSMTPSLFPDSTHQGEQEISLTGLAEETAIVLQNTQVRMRLSIKAISLILFTVELTLSISPRNSVLQNLPNSTDRLYMSSNHTSFNLTALRWSGVQSFSRCQGAISPKLDTLSCMNALEKIPLSGDPGTGVDVRFRHRYERPPAGLPGTV